MEDKHAKQIRNILAIMLTILLLAVFKITSTVSINLILSIFIFIFVMPVSSALEKHKVPSFIATIISILLIAVVIAVAVFFIVNLVDLMISTLPSYAPRIQQIDAFALELAGKWIDIPEGYSLLNVINIDWMSIVMPALKKVSSQTLRILSNGFVTLLFTVFLMLERQTIIPKLIMITARTSDSDKALDILENIKTQVSKYLFLKFIISAVTGIFFYLIALFVHLDFALLWGVMAFILNFIPSFGSIISTALTIAMSLIQFLPNWKPILIVTIATILTQNILGNLIDPRIQGSQLNLSPFVILVAASIFGYVWGIVGMFLAVPLLSVLEIIFANMENTKGIAIVLSSGKSLRKRIKSERKKMQEPDDSGFFFI